MNMKTKEKLFLVAGVSLSSTVTIFLFIHVNLPNYHRDHFLAVGRDHKYRKLRLPPKCSGPNNPDVHPEDKYDIFKLGPFKFLENYKNPCWLNENRELQCLPYFHLTGIPKSGTTDLYVKIIQHPEIAKLGKEVGFHWFTRHRFLDENTGFRYYINCRKHVIPDLENLTIAHPYNESEPFHPMITGDGAVSTFWDNRNWPRLPGNENCTEPRITNAMLLYHLFPGTRIINIFRNPTERLYSDYLFFNRGVSKETFHDACVKTIRLFNTCKDTYGIRYCVHNATVLGTFKVRLHLGLYAVYLLDWLDVFPENQILSVRTDDYYHNPVIVLRKIFRFLDVASLSPDELYAIANDKKRNVGGKKRSTGPMLNKTRNMLDKFYAPYNRQMAHLANDKGYEFVDAIN